MAGFTVVDSETVMATHLSHLMQVQASKLLSRTETQQLVEYVAKQAPKLIEEVVPKMVPIAVFQKVLQLLLEESVHIRDIRTIIEALAEHASSVSEPAELARGKQLFLTLQPACAVCHTLQAAGAQGQVGPVLDEIKPDANRVLSALRNGIGAMPSFAEKMTEKDMQAVARFVAHSTGAAP